jgi:catechol 2,3-dioxygenase-like lactoylglutathione lyase family enzyme
MPAPRVGKSSSRIDHRPADHGRAPICSAGRATLRIFWELRNAPLTFSRAAGCGYRRIRACSIRGLRELREIGWIEHDAGGYRLTRAGVELSEAMQPLYEWAGLVGKDTETATAGGMNDDYQRDYAAAHDEHSNGRSASTPIRWDSRSSFDSRISTPAIPRGPPKCSIEARRRPGSVDRVSYERGEHFHLYFETDDVEAEANRLRKKGVRLVRDVHATEWGARQFVLEDRSGTHAARRSERGIESRRHPVPACAGAAIPATLRRCAISVIPVTPVRQNCSLIWCEASSRRRGWSTPAGDIERIEAEIASRPRRRHTRVADARPSRSRRRRRGVARGDWRCRS